MNVALLASVTIVLLLAIAILSTISQKRERFAEPGFFGRIKNAIVGPETSQAPAQTAVVDGKTYPVCKDRSKLPTPDKYGRRWGYENGASCVVLSKPATAQTAVVDGKTYPVCKDRSKLPAPDKYGRRWGYENGASCVVLSKPATAQTGTSSKDNSLVVDGKRYPRCRQAKQPFTYDRFGYRHAVGLDGKACVDPPIKTTYNGEAARLCWNSRAPHIVDKQGYRLSSESGSKCVVPPNTVSINGRRYPKCKDKKSIKQVDEFGNRGGKEDGKWCALPPHTVPLGSNIYSICRQPQGPLKPDKNGYHLAHEKDGTPCAVPPPSVVIEGKLYPICKDPKNATTVDKHGHKHGQENGRECVVPALPKYIGTPAVPKYIGTPAVPKYIGTPAVSKYIATPAPTPQPPSTQMIDGKVYPICKDRSRLPAPDQYGRQWGWENEASCVVMN